MSKYCVYDKDGKLEGEYSSRRDATKKAAAIGGGWKKHGNHVEISKDLQEGVVDGALEWALESEKEEVWKALPTKAKKVIKKTDPVYIAKHTPHVDKRMSVGKGLTRLAARSTDKLVEVNSKTLWNYLAKVTPDIERKGSTRKIIGSANPEVSAKLKAKLFNRINGADRAMSRLGFYRNNLTDREKMQKTLKKMGKLDETSTIKLTKYMKNANRSIAGLGLVLWRASQSKTTQISSDTKKHLTRSVLNRQNGLARAAKTLRKRKQLDSKLVENLQETSRVRLFRYLWTSGKSVKKLSKDARSMAMLHNAGYKIPEKQGNEVFRNLKNRMIGTVLANRRLRGVELGDGVSKMADRKSLGKGNTIATQMNKSKLKEEKLNEISAKLAARYLVRRGAIFVDSKKNQVSIPSQQFDYATKNANQAKFRATVRGHMTSFERDAIRGYKKVAKGTEHALRKLTNKYQGDKGRIRQSLIDAESERLNHSRLVGKTPTINMQKKKFAALPTIPPAEELRKPQFKDVKKREQARVEKDMPHITYVEPDIPTQHHVVTSAGRVMFSGKREEAYKLAHKFGHSSGKGLDVIESNHPKIKKGVRLSAEDMKELRKQSKGREQNESAELMELSSGTLVNYAVKAERAFRGGADKRAPGLKKVLGVLRNKGPK